MANKTISMGEAIEALSDKMKQEGGNFSARLDEIVERYSILLDLEVLPDFSPEELTILGEVICGSVIDRRKVRGLHLDVLDAATGTQAARNTLSAKVAEMTVGQRLALIEKIGQ